MSALSEGFVIVRRADLQAMRNALHANHRRLLLPWRVRHWCRDECDRLLSPAYAEAMRAALNIRGAA